MSPTAPTFVTLNNQLNKAHRRIRALEARETELVAHNRTLCAVMEELANADHPRKAADVTPSSNNDSDGRLSTGDHLKHPRQHAGPTPQSPKPVGNPTSARASATGTSRVKTRRSHMFDLDPSGTIFLIIVVLWLVAAIAYGAMTAEHTSATKSPAASITAMTNR